MTDPDRDPELERLLRAALHAEAARATPAGDGLARIRDRTSSRAGFGRMFRPALAGAALTFTLIAGTLIGIRMTEDGNRTELAQPAVTGAPIVVNPPAVKPPVATAPIPVGPAVLPAPVTTAAPSPAATTGPRADVTAPPTGLATSTAARCVPNTTLPADDGGNYIAITSPGSGCPVTGPSFTVSGRARVFEAALTIDVMQNNVILHSANVSASQGAPELGTWSTMFALEPGSYRVEAYALSPADGSRMVQDTIWISVATPSTP